MKKRAFRLVAIWVMVPLIVQAQTMDPIPPSPFVQNLGQVIDTDDELHEEINYYTDVQGYRAYLTSNSVYYAWHIHNHSTDADTVYRMDMNFLNFNSGVAVSAGNQLSGRLNYLLGYLPDTVTGVLQYDTIVYDELYKGIDLRVSNNSWSLVYDYEIEAGANPGEITMLFEGADAEINASDELVLSTDFGEILYEVPTAYYLDGETQVPVSVAYSLSDHTLTFDVDAAASGQHVFISMARAAYPPSSAFVTTGQQQLYWSTYFGTDGGTEMHESHLDAWGDLYITGGTAAGIFPSSNSLAIPFSGGWDAIVAKFTTGRELIYVTWIGSSTHDEGWSITSQSHHPCFTGRTTGSNFPTTSNAVQGAPGIESSFYVKLDDDSYGADMLFSTYLGYGTFNNGGYAITCDSYGNVYVGLSSLQHTMVPIVNQSGAYNQSTHGGGLDGYIAKFSSADVQVWGSYLGGAGDDVITGLDTDPNDKLYMIGWSDSPTATQNCASGCTGNSNSGYFPIADPQNSVSYQQQLASSGQIDAFVAVFNSSNKLMWSSMFGGTGLEGICEGHDGAIAVDKMSGAFYITTSSRSSTISIQPTSTPSNTNVYWQNSRGGGQNDAVIAKFNPSYHLVYCTFYGGDGDDIGSDISITYYAAANRSLVYVSGGIFMSAYTTFPVLTQTNYVNIAPNGVGQGYLIMLDDDPDDFDALPERDWASCIGTGGTDMWFVSAQNDRLVAGGWTNANFSPAPVSDPDPASFSQPSGLAGYNGCILEFVFCNSCRFAGPVRNTPAVVYPNPSLNGIFTVTIPEDMRECAVSLTVYDMLGQEVLIANSNGHNTATLDLSDQPNGVYVLVMENGDKNNSVRIVNSSEGK